MVFEVSGNQSLSTKNEKTITERCQEVIRHAQCFQDIKEVVLEPILAYYRDTARPPKTIPKDAVHIAWNILRQGSLLCHLANHFRSGMITDIRELPPSADGSIGITEATFSDANARHNMKAFIDACTDELYMTDDQVFEGERLYSQDTNTLTKAIALATNFYSRIERTSGIDYEAICAQLDATAGFGGEQSATSLALPLTVPGREEEADDRQQGATDVRLMVLRETLQTERDYVADLERLQAYSEELRMDKVLSPESQARLFSNLDRLVDFQRHFLLRMEDCLTEAALQSTAASYDANVADLFIANEGEFSVYRTFCANHKVANDVIDGQIEALQTKESIMEPNVVLRAFLIKPIQRICKYPLLLRELIKHTRSTDAASDIDRLRMAADAVNRITVSVNEAKRESENAIVAEGLFADVPHWKLLEPQAFGPLLAFETLGYGESVEACRSKEYDAFLFDTIIVICALGTIAVATGAQTRTASRRPLVRRIDPLKGHFFIDQVTQAVPLSSLRGSAPSRLILKVTYEEEGDTEMAFLKFSSEERITAWLQVLRGRLGGLLPAIEEEDLDGSAQAPPLVSALRTEAGALETALRIKIHDEEGDIFMMQVVPASVRTLASLREALLAKVNRAYAAIYDDGRHLGDGSQDEAAIRLKYTDDEGDLVRLVDDEDVVMALNRCATAGLSFNVHLSQMP